MLYNKKQVVYWNYGSESLEKSREIVIIHKGPLVYWNYGSELLEKSREIVVIKQGLVVYWNYASELLEKRWEIVVILQRTSRLLKLRQWFVREEYGNSCYTTKDQ